MLGYTWVAWLDTVWLAVLTGLIIGGTARFIVYGDVYELIIVFTAIFCTALVIPFMYRGFSEGYFYEP